MSDERFDDIDQVYQRMEGSARMRFVPQNLLDIKSPQDLQEARAFIDRIIDQDLVTGNGLARRTGIKPSAISAFRNNKWKGSEGTLYTTASELVRAVDQLLKQRQDDERRADAGQFEHSGRSERLQPEPVRARRPF